MNVNVIARKDEESRHLLTDVAACTFTFSDGLESKINTSPENDLILVRLFPRKSKQNQFEELVLSNFRATENAAELAELCGYNCIKTFTRHFKKYFGETPYQWMIDRKMEEIRTIVLRTSTNFTKISLMYGFKSVSHMVNAYTKKYGISPLKDRLATHNRLGRIG